MIVAAVAALEALFYLSNVPVLLAVALEWDGRLRAGAALRPFDGASARRRAFRAMGERAQKKRRGGRVALSLLRRLRPEVRLRGTLCLGDAAATALACGWLNALGAALPGAKLRLEPDFNGADIRLAFSGMLSTRAGQIMLAAARCGIDSLNRRISAWKTIPFRVS